jgi:hypothetical protein
MIGNTNSNVSPSYKSDDIIYKEWESCRNVLKEFDTRIHDIRKFGFTFLTGLIAAESVLIPESSFINKGSPGIPDNIKFGLFGVTLLLILTMRVIEKNYQLYQICSAQRAQVLERRMNLELTEIISDRHRKKHIPSLVTSIYILFTLSVGLLGYTILDPNFQLVYLLLVCTILVSDGLILLQWYDLRYARGHIDWTVDKVVYNQGEKVRITITNLNENQKKPPIKLGPGVVWTIETQDGDLIYREDVEKPIFLLSEGNYTWEWNTDKIECGIYEVMILYKDNKKKIKDHNLRRKIRIEKCKEKSE